MASGAGGKRIGEPVDSLSSRIEAMSRAGGKRIEDIVERPRDMRRGPQSSTGATECPPGYDKAEGRSYAPGDGTYDPPLDRPYKK